MAGLFPPRQQHRGKAEEGRLRPLLQPHLGVTELMGPGDSPLGLSRRHQDGNTSREGPAEPAGLQQAEMALCHKHSHRLHGALGPRGRSHFWHNRADAFSIQAAQNEPSGQRDKQTSCICEAPAEGRRNNQQESLFQLCQWLLLAQPASSTAAPSVTPRSYGTLTAHTGNPMPQQGGTQPWRGAGLRGWQCPPEPCIPPASRSVVPGTHQERTAPLRSHPCPLLLTTRDAAQPNTPNQRRAEPVVSVQSPILASCY